MEQVRSNKDTDMHGERLNLNYTADLEYEVCFLIDICSIVLGESKIELLTYVRNLLLYLCKAMQD